MLDFRLPSNAFIIHSNWNHFWRTVNGPVPSDPFPSFNMINGTIRHRNESITVWYQNYLDEIFVEFRQTQRKPHRNENFAQHSTAKFDLSTNLIANLIFAKRFKIRTVLFMCAMTYDLHVAMRKFIDMEHHHSLSVRSCSACNIIRIVASTISCLLMPIIFKTNTSNEH